MKSTGSNAFVWSDPTNCIQNRENLSVILLI